MIVAGYYGVNYFDADTKNTTTHNLTMVSIQIKKKCVFPTKLNK